MGLYLLILGPDAQDIVTENLLVKILLISILK